MRSDLSEFHGIDLDDVWEGRVSPDRTLSALRMMPFNSRSSMHAVSLGGLVWRGWGPEVFATANVHDVIASLIAGLSGKRSMPDEWVHKRPNAGGGDEKVLFAKTIAEFNVDQFLSMVHSDQA